MPGNRPKAPRWRQAAADPWYEGVLLGNGDLGVVAFGATDRIVFALGKNDFWDRRYYFRLYKPLTFRQFMEMVRSRLPVDPSSQQVILDGSVYETSEPIPDGSFPSPKLVCRVTVFVPGGSSEKPLKPIRHSLSLEEAELTTTSPLLRIVSRVQKNANLVFIRVACPSEAARVVLSRAADASGSGIVPPIHSLDGTIGVIVQDMPPEVTYPDGFRCCVAGAVVEGDEPELVDGEIAWNLAGTRTLALAVATTRDDPDPIKAAKNLLWEGLHDNLGDRHLRLWREFWDASWIRLDDRPMERLWYMHNYLLASAARPGAVAPGLFGPWIVEDSSAWRGSYTMDYNFQQTFAAALSCNHCELIEPYLETIERMLPAARQFAREVYEAEGIAVPHEVFPIDMRKQGHASATYICETPWAAQHFWEYYEYTLDEDFLQKRGYPVIAGCADFLASIARPEGDGKHAFYPTRSPEHHGLMPGLPFNRNGTPELGFAGYIFQAAISAAEILGEDGDHVARWKEVLDGLPDYPRFRNQLGEVFADCEATSPEMNLAAPPAFIAPEPFQWFHRPSKRPGNHGPWMTYNIPTSILQIWPAGQIDMDSPPDDLLTAIRTWLTLKCEGSNDLIIRHVAAARLGIPTLTQLKNEIAPRLMPNGSITCLMNPLFEGKAESVINAYRANGVYMENCAYPLVINEMMLQSHNGVIKLFPTMDYYRKAEFHNLRARGGFLISAAMDRGFVMWAEVTPTVERCCRIRMPWPEHAISVEEVGSDTPVEVHVKGDDILFHALKGITYRLSPGGEAPAEPCSCEETMARREPRPPGKKVKF